MLVPHGQSDYSLESVWEMETPGLRGERKLCVRFIFTVRVPMDEGNMLDKDGRIDETIQSILEGNNRR